MALSELQRDALALAETEEERLFLIKMIKRHGEFYRPPAFKGDDGWWPNKDPDM